MRRWGQDLFKVPLLKGDLGGSGYVQRPIKRVPQNEWSYNNRKITIDAKAAVKVGEFDRGGKTRMPTIALDHDFATESTVIPYGIFLPEYNELFLFFVTSKLTADCIVDLLENWWQTVKHRFSHIQKLVINQDNGPENNSRRSPYRK